MLTSVASSCLAQFRHSPSCTLVLSNLKGHCVPLFSVPSLLLQVKVYLKGHFPSLLACPLLWPKRLFCWPAYWFPVTWPRLVFLTSLFTARPDLWPVFLPRLNSACPELWPVSWLRLNSACHHRLTTPSVSSLVLRLDVNCRRGWPCQGSQPGSSLQRSPFPCIGVKGRIPGTPWPPLLWRGYTPKPARDPEDPLPSSGECYNTSDNPASDSSCGAELRSSTEAR